MNLSKSEQSRIAELESNVKNFVNAVEQVFGGSTTTNAAWNFGRSKVEAGAPLPGAPTEPTSPTPAASGP